ncbi:NUDIX pyrophosphatase [Patescibacteria group bacterium]|nr:NUDIX pyrophosphatase [Patescibacteria group bacterium]
MGIKINNPKNSIIIEGLWGTGKTLVANTYCNKYNYKLISEPVFEDSGNITISNNKDQWYIKNHTEREHYLQESYPVLLERSILSTYAFLYVLHKTLPDELYIKKLQKSIEENKILLVFLKNTGAENLELNKKYSPEIQNIITNENNANLYNEWYTKILPFKYGIVPFVLNIKKEGVRNTTEVLVNNIYLALTYNRIAQVNIVCFTESLEGIKILILKRNKIKGGFWQTVTGGIHPGENLFNASKRELMEETGFGESDGQLLATDYIYSFIGNDNYELHEYVFGYKINDPAKFKISTEHDEFQWCSPTEAKEKMSFETNKNAIDAVIRKLSSSSRTAQDNETYS